MESDVTVLSWLVSFYEGLGGLGLALFVVAQIPLAVAGRVMAAALEWAIHRYLFHVMGKRKGSMFAFHWKEHHRACRKVEMRDDAYVHGSLLDWRNGHAREIWAIVAACIAMSPGLLVVPGFVIGASYGGWRYHWCHRQSHLDPQWGKEKLRWHYDHHMAPNQDTNWGVSNEWFDKWMGTRVPWAGPKKRTANDGEDRAAK